MFHHLSGNPSVLCESVCVCVGHLGPSVCQDIPSFDNSLSRCFFCPACVCVFVLLVLRDLVYQDVKSLSTDCQYVCVCGWVGD